MSEQPIYLTQEEYNQYVAEIEVLRDKLGSSSTDKSESYRVGDEWQDNFAFENAKSEELVVLKELEEKIKGLSRIVVVDVIDDSDVIGINDIVRLTVQLPSGRSSEQIVILTGVENSYSQSCPKEISTSSPLGKAVYGKKVGDIANYLVNGKELVAIIEEKIDEKEINDGDLQEVQRKR